MFPCLLCVLVSLTEPPCSTRPAPRSFITESLMRYGERQIDTRFIDPITIVELWANPDTHTWSMLKTRANGLSCFSAAGSGWRPPVKA